MDPLSDCLRIDLLLLLVEDGEYLFLGICQIFILLVGGVEIELAHLMGLQRNLYEVDYLDKFVHA